MIIKSCHSFSFTDWAMRRFFHLLLGLSLAFLMLHPVPSLAADGPIAVETAEIDMTDDGYRLASTFSLDLPRGLEDVLQRGIPLYFTTQLEISRPRWFWLDEKPVVASRTIRIGYNVLTRQYSATLVGSLQQNVSSLEEALHLVRNPQRWTFADKNRLQQGTTYSAAVRIQLDMSFLPKPFQINVINNSNWRLSSDWKHFSFTA